MARPAADSKILKDNRSTYNLIAHDHHVPRSPLFGPSPRRGQDDYRTEYDVRRADDGGREYGDNREGGKREVWENVISEETSRHYEPDNQAPEARSPGPTSQTTRPHVPDYQPSWDYPAALRMIKHERHVPASPLYRPGQGQSDPRYGSAQGDKGDNDRRRAFQVPRPKDPPTPDYNTTQLHIPDTHNEEEEENTKLQLGGLRGSQEDLRELKTNNVTWAGYQDKQVNRGHPNTDRPGYSEDRLYRENPWTSRSKVPGDVADPRVGGQHDGIGLIGTRNGGALLFIRFPVGHGENIQVAAQAFLKSKTHDNGGQFLGLAKKVHDFGYERGPTEAVGVFHFPSTDKAFLFFQMDPILRQPDFPPPYGHAEMWIICNAYLPDNLRLFNTFLLSEVELHSGKEKREFFETFQKPFESYLYKNGAMPFVVCSYGAFDRKSLRRHNYPPTSIVTCHLFQGLDHLNWLTSDETYSKFRSLHNQMATEKCSIFTLCKDMFP